MKNQTIKTYVDIFEPFIKEICPMENNAYVFDHNIYKRIAFDGKLNHFLEQLKTYYFKNKHYYIQPEDIKYNRFLTIIRQVCNKNDIIYKKNIKYIMSKYTVSYEITF